MPKKRSYLRYSKPPSVAPPSLSLSSSAHPPTESHSRSVNEILANLRRTTLTPAASQPATSYSAASVPSVPPTLQHILQIPETPAPPPRRLQRRDLNGRRVPPGPPPPPSWIVPGQPRHTSRQQAADHNVENQLRHWPLPSAYAPPAGSLIDIALQRMALDWAQQRDWNRFHLYTLPSRLRSALIGYISQLHNPGASLTDLRLILLGPTDEELSEYDIEPSDPSSLNGDIFSLDLTGSLGRSITLKELNDLLFGQRAPTPSATEIVDSWDAPIPAIRSLEVLPNLTYLSLAIELGSPLSVSWKQLLCIAKKMSRLTQLSLAGWPEPSLTPNAKFAKVTSSVTGLSVQYGGTGPYSHRLDEEWSEAVLLLRRLSKMLYRLEYLDLTGCGDWAEALRTLPEGSNLASDQVDWVGDWGKITTLRLNSGYSITELSPSFDTLRIENWIDSAVAIERHIRTRRSGRGRWITVERDTLPDGSQGVNDMSTLNHTAVE
ncbi:hypothetical protein F5Y16DRAFT_314573 [Xylariaceae sp. FL0255]|nr:hypothetical protein F5Y16DRAFT_314573 [Xylariaceae sp. FL0255]